MELLDGVRMVSDQSVEIGELIKTLIIFFVGLFARKKVSPEKKPGS